jgi:hypothetical protein
MSSMFYLFAIVLVMVSPLIVPVSITILHTVRDWKLAGAPAFAGAVPAAA